MTADRPATRARLIAATQEALRLDGVSGLSARGIARRADVNQALVFYHFGTVDELVEAAFRQSVDDSLIQYRSRFATVRSLSELLVVGRVLHEQERAAGNVAMMAQVLAGAQQDETLARAARYALGIWNAEIEVVVRRVLAGTVLADAVDPAGLARAITAGFVGLELFEGVDGPGAADALDALAQLGSLVALVDELGPVATRALRARVRRGRRGH